LIRTEPRKQSKVNQSRGNCGRESIRSRELERPSILAPVAAAAAVPTDFLEPIHRVALVGGLAEVNRLVEVGYAVP
jgi:hypothetical protein